MDKKKVVIVDDEKDLALLIKAILEGTGKIEAFLAHDGLEGLELIAKIKPDMIFLDFVMPKAGGDKVIAALKKNPETEKLPIVLMSGLGEMVYSKAKDQWKWQPNNPGTKNRGEIPQVLAEKGSAERVIESLGVKDYLQKPFKKEILIDVATSILKLDQPEEGQEDAV